MIQPQLFAPQEQLQSFTTSLIHISLHLKLNQQHVY